ncbi:MAG: hypothetical protein FJZ64_02430 [Chlamydiae bacterium]|nr:hypothetical protein [Chlamydiota bacterium]
MISLLLRFGSCLLISGACLYSYLETQNQLTELKIQIPKVDREIAKIREENQKLTYEIDKFLSPANLIELATRPEYSHLKHPVLEEILTVPEILASNQ